MQADPVQRPSDVRYLARHLILHILNREKTQLVGWLKLQIDVPRQN